MVEFHRWGLPSPRAAAAAMLAVTVVAAVVLTGFVGSGRGDPTSLVEEQLHRDPYLLPRTGSFLMRETDQQPMHEKHEHHEDAAEKRRRQQEEVHKALHHLSSSALVQRAASECAAESKCVPSVDELVKRAASACAKDPACVCDWGRYPKQCFLSEVQRHEQLVKAAKNLEKQLKQREQQHVETKSAIQQLEEDDKDFATVLGNGQRALEGGDFEAAKHSLAHAEFLHEKMVHSGGAHTPAEERQEEELKRFAKEVVEKEAHMPAREEEEGGRRSREEARDGERQRRGESRVERQLSTLTDNVQTLMKAVGSIEQQRELKALPQASDSSPRGKMQQLVQEVGVLSGKLSTLEKRSDHRGPAAVSSDPDQVEQGRGREGKERAEAISHQESSFAQAIAHGEREAFRHNLQEARVALQEARYYHSEVVRLRGMSPSAACHPCDALSRTIHRVALSSTGRGRTSALYEEEHSDRQHAAHADEEERRRPRGRHEEEGEEERRARGREQREGAEEERRRQVVRDSSRQEPREHSEEPRHEPALRERAAGRERGDSPPSAHKLEMSFDAALSDGERELLRGKIPSAVEQDERAKRLLHKLDKWTLGENDGVVKHEMAEALASFTKGVEHRGGRLSGAVPGGDGDERRATGRREEGGQGEAEQERRRSGEREEEGGSSREGDAPLHQLRGAEGAREGERRGRDARAEEAKARLERRARMGRREGREERGDEQQVATLGRREAEDRREMKQMQHEERRKEKLPAYRRVSWREAPFPQQELSAIYAHFSHA